MPAASAFVTHVAVLLEIVTLEHPVIDVPSLVKFTVPVAPVVTVAVKVSYEFTTMEELEMANVVDEELPGITATRGVERWLYPAPLIVSIDT